MPWSETERREKLNATLLEMNAVFVKDPRSAVRGQTFIQLFHDFIAEDIRSHLTTKAVRAGIEVVQEARVFGSFKSKDVDVAVIHPVNGPLVLVGVRSQMSSIGKNVLTYYQDIVGEAISLQERFPMATAGYAYLHPLEVVPWERKDGTMTSAETPDHCRFAQMYANIGHRDDRLYKHQTGSYDQFAYTVVDFQDESCPVRDDIISDAVPDLDLSIMTFVPRLVRTFVARNLWVQDIFVQPDVDLPGPSPITQASPGFGDDALTAPE